jgi:hypothetical protein
VTQPPIECRSAMRELWEYLDDELPANRAEQIREHLATCEGCRSHVEFCRGFLMRIELAPVPTTEVAGFRNRLALALAQEGLVRSD